jgi:hypothetical protein
LQVILSLSLFSYFVFLFSFDIFGYLLPHMRARQDGAAPAAMNATTAPDQETSLLLSSSMRHSLSKKKYLRTNNYMWEEPSIPFSLSLILLLLLFTDGNANIPS